METYYFIEAQNLQSVREGIEVHAANVKEAIATAELEACCYDTALILEDEHGRRLAWRQQPSMQWTLATEGDYV